MVCEESGFGVVVDVQDMYGYCDLSLKFLSLLVTMEGHFGLLGGVISAKRFLTSLLDTIHSTKAR